MGAAEGSSLGSSLGSAEGVAVGSSLGVSLGMALGVAVGSAAGVPQAASRLRHSVAPRIRLMIFLVIFHSPCFHVDYCCGDGREPLDCYSD